MTEETRVYAEYISNSNEDVRIESGLYSQEILKDGNLSEEPVYQTRVLRNGEKVISFSEYILPGDDETGKSIEKIARESEVKALSAGDVAEKLEAYRKRLSDSRWGR